MGFSLSKAFKSVKKAVSSTFDVLWEGSIAPLKFVADAVSGLGSFLGGPDIPDMPNPAQPTSQNPQVAKRKAIPGPGGTGGFSSPGPETLLTGGRGQTPTDSLLGSTSLLGR